MKRIQHTKVWSAVVTTLFAPTVFAHSPGELEGGFLSGLIHQLSSWHHLVGLLAIIAVAAAGYLLLARPRKKTSTQRSRKRL